MKTEREIALGLLRQLEGFLPTDYLVTYDADTASPEEWAAFEARQFYAMPTNLPDASESW